MGYLDQYGEAIAAAAAEAGIPWTLEAGDGLILYCIRNVDENGTPWRMLLSPGEFARMLGVEWPGFRAA
ncbi:MAG: hypothetical protein AABM30_03105 [Actinomycetota bacterium]